MPLSPNSNALALKRKLQQAESQREPTSKRHSISGYDPQTPWLYETAKPLTGWRTLGDPAVHNSLPLANMVSAVQDLIDPDFDPLTAILDEEPRFLKPLPSRIAPEDLEFLRFRGALSIPESGLRNELLRSYIRWVHSFMPILNLQELLRCVAENDPKGNISVLLFQAVMFVGTAFVDLKHLQDAGYSTRKSARTSFFTRLRLLYSLDCEEDRIVIAQAVLLMTYWSDTENSPQRDIWDWIGVCNTQVHSIGLNNDSSTADIDPQLKRLRTRIWWCLYSRDRLIAMGMRRPLQVNEGTSNVPMLKLDDFDFEPFSPAAVALFHCRQLEDVSHQKRLATMFIEKVKLCQCIGRVLFAQYAPSQHQFGSTDRTTVTLVPRQASESEFTRCNQKLDSWLGALPKDAQFIPASKSKFRDGEDVLLLHGAMLRMLYHATSSALHRPWAAHSKDQSKSRIEWRNIARTKMQEAASGITHIIQGLNQLNLTRFLPQSGVTVILPAAVAHLSNSMSDNPAIRESSIYNFQRCIHVLHCLKDMYPAANVEFANLEAAIKLQSGNYNSNTFFQIMQYNFDNSEFPLESAGSTGNQGNPESISTPNSFYGQDSKTGRDSQSLASHQARTPSVHENSQLQHRNSSIPTPRDETYTPQLSTRPFPNDFDDHFGATTATDVTNPFNFLTTEFDSFPDIVDSSSNIMHHHTNGTTDVPATEDFDDMDWTKALFQETPLPSLGKSVPGLGSLTLGQPRQSQSSDTPHSIAHRDQEEDIFAFALKDDKIPGSYHSRSYTHDITGDLDRDLGFQTGDEMF
ncbi:hypothetical protein N7493_002882 [Penicillium malachiteum]|uniref:Xylanolytic transcriptional activator regulatory domain-containing protein n=1 Tax=Penicillium malachiteum TaxID=1324776 RepID=A0AAD6MZ50_9EURO|nr:hypothetical protein N7493_002882 [Penicillium malachiteum]